MPIYEYQCKKCKAHIEVLQRVTDKPPLKCRKCGGRLERLASAPAIQFKGSGWYVTDYGKATKADKPDSGSAPSDEKKSDTKTKESSPAKKTSEKASPPKAPSGD